MYGYGMGGGGCLTHLLCVKGNKRREPGLCWNLPSGELSSWIQREEGSFSDSETAQNCGILTMI